MEYMGNETPATGPGMILCCQCGTQIEPNPANMCVACLRSQVDITEGIPKSAILYFCRNCERYLQPPGAWIKAALESRELLSICLKKVKGMNKEVRLIDAGFIWTEPHSKRIKVKLSIQKEVLGGAVLQQVFVVEYTVHNQMCDDCHRVEAKDYWRACVQVRQKTSHKKTLFYLEQMILKHRAHTHTSSIKPMHDGIDFYYATHQDSRKMVDFLHAVVPMKNQMAKELISHDVQNSTYNYKLTHSVEIVPVCKDNVVCMSPKLAQQMGNMGQIAVVLRVTQAMHIIDPNTCQIGELNGMTFWRLPFKPLNHPKQLIEYIVMEKELIMDKDKRHVAGQGQISQRHVLADIWVVKASELGMSGSQYHCRSHLGHLLNIGDTALGFDLGSANINDEHFEKMKPETIPDVVLVKKLYADSNKRARKRKWRLERLKGVDEIDTESVNRDYNDFLEDIEEDAIFRQNINVYKDSSKLAVDADDTDDEDMPKISLAEMLDEMTLVEDATGEDGDDMIE